jgi:hypothetical protein
VKHAQGRRNFLKTAGAVTAGIMSGSQAAPSEASPPPSTPRVLRDLPTIDLGGTSVSRLVLGSNAIGGYAHFNNTLGALMKEYFTEDNLYQLLVRAHEEGINFLQGHYDATIARAVMRLREAGGTMHWMFIVNKYPEGSGPYRMSLLNPEIREAIKTVKPIALIHHGAQGDDLYMKSTQDFEVVNDVLNEIADMGIVPGMSTHHPETIEYVEDKGWDCRFYMGCFYHGHTTKGANYQRWNERLGWKNDLGITPVGELYYAEQPVKVCKVLRSTSKPCFGYKILAAGRICDNQSQVEDCYKFAFQNLKPNDGIIVGMFPKFEDHVKQGADYTRKHGV